MGRGKGPIKVDEALRKLARGAVTSADKMLASGGSVHETRRTLKSLNSLLVLIHPAIGDLAYDQSRDLLQKIAKALAATRRLDAMGEMAEKLSSQTRNEAEVDALSAFKTRIESLAQCATAETEINRRDLRSHLRDFRKQILAWNLPPSDLSLLLAGAGSAYRKARRRILKGLKTRNWKKLHSGRQALIHHLHHLSILDKLGVETEADRIGAIEKLRRALGDLNDLEDAKAMLAEKTNTFANGKEERAFRAVMQRWRRRLLKKAAKLASELLSTKPRTFTKQIRVAWDALLLR